MSLNFHLNNATANETRVLVVALPAGNQELHGLCVIAGAEPVGLVDHMRCFQCGPIDLYALRLVFDGDAKDFRLK